MRTVVGAITTPQFKLFCCCQSHGGGAPEVHCCEMIAWLRVSCSTLFHQSIGQDVCDQFVDSYVMKPSLLLQQVGHPAVKT